MLLRRAETAYLLEGPLRQVQVGVVAAAPPLVAGGVGWVVARAGVHDLDLDGLVVQAEAGAVEGVAAAVRHGRAAALHLKALPASFAAKVNCRGRQAHPFPASFHDFEAEQHRHDARFQASCMCCAADGHTNVDIIKRASALPAVAVERGLVGDSRHIPALCKLARPPVRNALASSIARFAGGMQRC